MQKTIQINQYIIELVAKQARYYTGDLQHLDSAQWLKEVNHLNNQIANEFKHLYLTQIFKNSVEG